MILKDSILSAFTDKATLLLWLKKVEKALRENVLVDISISQVNETQIKIKFTFESGDFVESPILTLPQGPKGDTGLGVDDTSAIEFGEISGSQTLDEGVDIEGEFKFFVDGEIYSIPSRLLIPIKGSETIVVDIDEDGKSISIHLDHEIISKLSRALMIPAVAPSSTILVGINTNKEQRNIKLGTNFVIEGETLLLNRPPLFLHNVSIKLPQEYEPKYIDRIVINARSEKYEYVCDFVADYGTISPNSIIEGYDLYEPEIWFEIFNAIITSDMESPNTVCIFGTRDSDSLNNMVGYISNVEIEDNVTVI